MAGLAFSRPWFTPILLIAIFFFVLALSPSPNIRPVGFLHHAKLGLPCQAWPCLLHRFSTQASPEPLCISSSNLLTCSPCDPPDDPPYPRLAEKAHGATCPPQTVTQCPCECGLSPARSGSPGNSILPPLCPGHNRAAPRPPVNRCLLQGALLRPPGQPPVWDPPFQETDPSTVGCHDCVGVHGRLSLGQARQST